MRFQKILIKDCRRFPIHMIDFSNNEEKIIYDHMVSLVKQMTQLHKDIYTARIPQDKELIQRQIDATDKQIDNLVYELYGLTEEEIEIINGDKS